MNVHLRILPGTHAPTDGVVMHPHQAESDTSETTILEPLTDEERKSASEYLREMISTLPDCDRK